MRTPTSILLLLLSHAMDVTIAPAADFTRFRGADATGVAKDHPNLPDRWNKTDNVAWVTDVPGQGWGSPIVVGDRVFVSSVVSDEENTKPKGGLYLGQGVRDPEKGIHHWMVYCFDLKNGKELWRHEAHTGRPVVPRHPKSSYAAETPTTDGERMFVLFGDLGLYCYSLNGDLLWSKPIEPKKTNMDYGAAASPVVHEGQVIVVYDNKEDSWIASFDAETGEQRWITKRDETMSWATPFVWQNEQRTEIVVPGQRNNRSYSLDGKELWSFDGNMSVLVIPSPFAAHGMCYISSGYVGDAKRPTFAIRPGANGKLVADGKFDDSEFIEWYQPQASPYNTTQIVYGDYLYTVYDQGFMTCHNALTGKEVYGKQRFSPKGSFTSSPWAYNGKVFCLSEDGLTYVIKAGPEFEILDTNPLDELCIATPSVVDGKLLVRTLTKVYCITQGETTAATDPKKEFSARDLPNYQGLVSVRWVKAVLDYQSGTSANTRPESFSGEQFVVVEASWSTLENASEYHRAHVPGAIHVNTDDFENGSPRWRLKDLAQLQRVIGQMGVTPETTVVVYGSKLIAAARVWWILKYAGVADVRLMDGNIQTWSAAGFPTEKTVNVLPTTSFTHVGKSNWLAKTESVAKAIQSRQHLLADVRSDAEYRGRKSGYDYLDAKGRIPGAIHLGDADDSSQNYRKADGRLRSPVEVLAEWKELGLVPDPSGNRFEHDVIFYCGGGWRSSVAFFYAWLLGFENIQNYSDGWSGWSTQYQQSADAKGGTPGWKQVPTGNPFESGYLDRNAPGRSE